MTRQILILCDRCAELGRESTGSPRLISTDGAKSFVLDLCDDCHDHVLGPVLKLLATYGVAADTVAPQPSPRRSSSRASSSPKLALDPVSAADRQRAYPTTCLACDKVLNTASHVGEHLRRDHQATSTRDIWGHSCPICGKEGDRTVMHVKIAHNMDINDAVRQALQAGDPHGVATAIMSRLATNTAA